MFHFLKLLIQLILAPGNGWIDIESDPDATPRLASRSYLTLLGATSLSVFIAMIYHADLSVVTLVQKAIVVYMAFFITVFIAEFFFSLFFIRDTASELQPNRIRIFIYFCLSTMALMSLLVNCVPFSPVLILLPLYSIVVMRMGSRYMQVIDHRMGHFMLLTIGSIFAPPFLIIFLFGLLIG